METILLDTDDNANAERSRRSALLTWGQDHGMFTGATRDCQRVALRLEQPRIMAAVDPRGTIHARWSGIQRCKSSTRCPHCAPIEAATKASEINRVIFGHLGGLDGTPDGRGLYLATLTIPHRRGLPLAQLLEWVTSAWQRFATGPDGVFKQRGALEDHGPFAGWVAGVEMTWNARSGWNPHIHVLIFTSQWENGTKWAVESPYEGVQPFPVSDKISQRYHIARKPRQMSREQYFEEMEMFFDDIQIENWNKRGLLPGEKEPGKGPIKVLTDPGDTAVDRLYERLVQEWSRCVAATAPAGWPAEVNARGIDLRSVPSLRGVGSYFLKIGFELTGGTGLKIGRTGSLTPLQLLRTAATTEDNRELMASLWREYERTIQGRRLLRWSAATQNLRQTYASAPDVPFTDPGATAHVGAGLVFNEVCDVAPWAYETMVHTVVLTPDEARLVDELDTLSKKLEVVADRVEVEMADAGVEMTRREVWRLAGLERERAAREAGLSEEEAARWRHPSRYRPTGRRATIYLLQLVEAGRAADVVAWCNWLNLVSDYLNMATETALHKQRAVDKMLAGLLSEAAPDLF